MIRVEPAPEPSGFSGDVREPGYRALAEMVGESTGRSRGKRFPKIAATRAEIPPQEFPTYSSSRAGRSERHERRSCIARGVVP